MIITWSLHHYYIIITFTIIITVTHSYIGCYYISLQNHITILLQHYHDYIMITSLLQMGNNESIIQCHAKSKPPLYLHIITSLLHLVLRLFSLQNLQMP